MDVEHFLPRDLVISSRSDLYGNITECNVGFIEASGYSKDELIGKPHSMLRHPDVPKVIFDDLWKCLDSGLSWTGVLKNKRKDGDFYWVCASVVPIIKAGKKVGYVSVRYPATDDEISCAEFLYTQLNQNKRVLPKNKNVTPIAGLSVLVISILFLVGMLLNTILSTQSLVELWFVFISVVLSCLGIYMLWGFLFPSHKLLEDVERLSSGDFRSTISGNTFISAYLNIVRASLAEIESKNYDVRSEYNDLKKQEEDHLKALALQSRHAIMGEMIAIISHQWRQPLALSMLNVEILSRKLSKISIDEKDKSFLSHRLDLLKSMVQEQSNLISDFTNFFKPDKEKSFFNVLGAVKSVLSMLEENLSSHGVKLNKKINERCELFGVEREFRQVILNIVKNAIDQLVEKNVKNPYIHINVDSNSEFVTIEISDNGGGIKEEILPTLFDIYVSTKSLNGTGLGLYMVKMIVVNHLGGVVTAYNSSEGAVFRIVIPVTKVYMFD